MNKSKSIPHTRKTVPHPAPIHPRNTTRTRPTTHSHAQTATPAVTMRLYCQGIGDCHLLKFPSADGKDFWMLIDCGIHSSVTNGTQTIDTMVKDIASVTSRLDVIVGTHEHWDHLSGFLTAAETFETLRIGEVWLAWTENPHDEQARSLDHYKGQAIAALEKASQRLSLAPALSPHLSSVRAGVESVLGFVRGMKGERVRDARDALVALAPKRVQYLEPKRTPITLPQLPGLRIYVLGPSRDPKLLGITEKASEMYGVGAAAEWPLAAAMMSAFNAHDENSSIEDYAAPFDPSVGCSLAPILTDPTSARKDASAETIEFINQHYRGLTLATTSGSGDGEGDGDGKAAAASDQSWRRIDGDWLGSSADLAMQLDDKTNNTSLALAFEFIDTGRVLLFAADAQVGEWLGWQKVECQVGNTRVTGADLLARTVFYKVGHHGSQNATLKQKGLELMVSHDLSAFIPTNEKDAKKVRWGQMPFPGICTDLEERSAGRVIRADDPWVSQKTGAPGFEAPSGSIQAVRHEPGLWVELDIA